MDQQDVSKGHARIGRKRALRLCGLIVSVGIVSGLSALTLFGWVRHKAAMTLAHLGEGDARLDFDTLGITRGGELWVAFDVSKSRSHSRVIWCSSCWNDINFEK